MSNIQPTATSQTEVYHLNDADGWELKRVYKNRGPFTSISPIRTKFTINWEPDVLDLLGDLSKCARDLFLEIKRNMDYSTYIAVLSNDELTQSQKNKRSQAIQELESTGYGLAKRVPQSGITSIAGYDSRFKPSTFILSPEYVYPSPKFEDEIKNIWRQCKAMRNSQLPITP
jgi:hypothetical protein